MTQIVQGKDGGCFTCGQPVHSIKSVRGQYDNGEATTVVIALCKDCGAKK